MTRASIDRDASSSRDYSINIVARARFRARDFQDREASPSNSSSDYDIALDDRENGETIVVINRLASTRQHLSDAFFARTEFRNIIAGGGWREGIETKFVP